jgi:DNA-directed RNA polymerase specialized sigma24 family protein
VGNGSRGHFDDAFAPLFKDAFDVAYLILDDVDNAEDAAAEAMARADVRWTRMGKRADHAAWVMCAAANVAMTGVGERPANGAASRALREALISAVAQLPRRERDVVVLRYLAGLSEEEIAVALGISVNSVKQRTLRATTDLGDRVGHETKREEPVGG